MIARLTAALDASWHAIYVETPELSGLPDSRRKVIVATLKLAQMKAGSVSGFFNITTNRVVELGTRIEI